MGRWAGRRAWRSTANWSRQAHRWNATGAYRLIYAALPGRCHVGAVPLHDARFRIRAVGANARAAAGGRASRAVGGAGRACSRADLAGVAGAIEVAGRTGYVTLDMSPGYGYSGIVIAMLAGLHRIWRGLR